MSALLSAIIQGRVNEQPLPETTVETFFSVDIRLGRVLSAVSLDGARKPAYKLEIDFGSLGVKHSSAQLTELYDAAELVGRQVLAVVNFPPRRIAGFKSEVLTLGVPDEQGNVVLLAPERQAPLGGRVF
jgi:tRNA-binding protein